MRAMRNSDAPCSDSGRSPKSRQAGKNVTPDLERLATAAHEAALAERNEGEAPNDSAEDGSTESEGAPEGPAKRVIGCAAPVCLHPELPLLEGDSEHHPNAVLQICAVCNGPFHGSCGKDCESESAKANLEKYGFADARNWCGCELGTPLKGDSMEDNKNKTRIIATQAQPASTATDGGDVGTNGLGTTVNEQAGTSAGRRGGRARTAEEKERAGAIKREKDRARQKRHRDKRRQKMASGMKVQKQAQAPEEKTDAHRGGQADAEVHVAKSINLEASHANPLMTEASRVNPPMTSFDGGASRLRPILPKTAVPSVQHTFQAQGIAIPPAAPYGTHCMGSIKNIANPASTAGYEGSMEQMMMERTLTGLLENFTAKGHSQQQSDERIALLEENKKKIEICNMAITSWTIVLNTQGVDADCRAMASKELSQAMKDLKQCREASMLLGASTPSASHQPSGVQHQ